MSQKPINRTVRFFLEFAGLAAMTMWGMRQGEGGLRFLWALGIPLFAAGIWMRLRIQEYRGRALAAVPGVVRLSFELVLFGFSVWTVYDMGATALAWIFGVIVILHYALSYDRILSLLRA